MRRARAISPAMRAAMRAPMPVTSSPLLSSGREAGPPVLSRKCRRAQRTSTGLRSLPVGKASLVSCRAAASRPRRPDRSSCFPVVSPTEGDGYQRGPAAGKSRTMPRRSGTDLTRLDGRGRPSRSMVYSVTKTGTPTAAETAASWYWSGTSMVNSVGSAGMSECGSSVARWWSKRAVPSRLPLSS